METCNVIYIFIGLVAGIILFLLNKISSAKNAEEIRKQILESQSQQKWNEERIQKSDSELQIMTAKLDQKVQEIQGLISENASMLSSLQNAKDQLHKLNTDYADLKSQFQMQLVELADRNQKLSESQSQNKYFLERLESQKKDFDEIRKQSQLEFTNIANKILDEKTAKFTISNKENIDSLLKPLGEHLNSFKKQVEETYDKESKQRFSLEEKVKELVELNQKLSTDANNLTSALKGQSKKQGNWGEIILESILEKSGLIKNREYKVQVSIQNEEGRRLQPDVIVYLPENRTIIIDSKVSLVAYDRYSSADAKEDQVLALKEHIKSIYNHIDELGDKKYDTIAGTLDFTMMFFPIEPAYLLAIQEDQELWAYAYAKRILLISPTNLIAALKLVADLWKRELQSRNALEIAKQGERLYDKMIGFLESMEDVGKHIDRTQSSYDKAINQLRDGKGSLVRQAQKMKKLGLNSQKEIPDTLMPFDEDSDDS